MAYLNNRKPDALAKILSAACYPSCGLVGVIYIIFSRKDARSAPFFYFHFLQSIILGAIVLLLKWTGSTISTLLVGMLSLIFSLVPGAAMFPEFIGLAINWLIILVCAVIYILMIYGVIFALLGKYAEIPKLSALVRQNM